MTYASIHLRCPQKFFPFLTNGQKIIKIAVSPTPGTQSLPEFISPFQGSKLDPKLANNFDTKKESIKYFD